MGLRGAAGMQRPSAGSRDAGPGSGYADAVRQRGTRPDAGGLGRQDHGCLVHHDEATLAEAAYTFLLDGLGLGQKPMYVGTSQVVLDRLAELAVPVLVTDPYAHGLDPDHLAAAYTREVEQALAEGHTGLRTFAQMPPDADPEALVRWEARGDRLMTELPWSACCAYDGDRTPQSLLADVVCVHPVDAGAEPELTPFKLFNETPDRISLSGTVDTFSADDLARRLGVTQPAGAATLDLSGLEFIDHAGVHALAHARGDLTCTNPPYLATRVAGIMGITL